MIVKYTAAPFAYAEASQKHMEFVRGIAGVWGTNKARIASGRGCLKVSGNGDPTLQRVVGQRIVPVNVKFPYVLHEDFGLHQDRRL